VVKLAHKSLIGSTNNQGDEENPPLIEVSLYPFINLVFISEWNSWYEK